MRLTPEELQARKSHIGGSEAAAVLGLSKWKTPEQVRQEKLGLTPPWEGNLRTELGHILEPTVLGLYAEATGLPLMQVPARVHPSARVMAATPDAMITPKHGVDAKTAGRKSDDWGAPGTDEIPTEYLLQAQHYMAVWDAERWDMAVLFLGPGDFQIYTVLRDNKLIDMLVQRETAWWQRHIIEGEPCKPVNADDLKLLYPTDDGTILPATDEDIANLASLRDIKDEIKALEAQREELETVIRARLGAATALEWAGEKLVTYKAQHGSRLDQKRLKADLPEVAAKYTSQYVMRVLRAK